MLNPEQITTTNCPVCESSNFKLRHHLIDHEYQTTDQKFPVNECHCCGTFFLSPRPNESAFDIIYPKNYSNYRTNETKESHVRQLSNKLQVRRVKKLISSFSFEKGFSVLDVGCGDGFMLDRIKDAFPLSQTFGIEPNKFAAEIAARSHDVFHGTLEECPEIDKKFDIIISSHVIEHVSDPVGFLDLLCRKLKDDGVVIIDTPNVRCLQYKIFGKHWGGFHSPRHWTLFTPDSLVLSGYKAGLKKEIVKLCPINVFWVWSIHSLLYENTRTKKIADRFFGTQACVEKQSLYYLFLLVFFELLDRLSAPFGQGQMRVVFKKLNNQ